MNLQEFIINRKQELLQKERVGTGKVKDVILGQIQALESILIFLSSKQTEEDMAKLEIMLEDQTMVIEDIQALRRRGTGELTELLKAFSKKIESGTGKPLKLPPTIKPTVVVAKIHYLRKQGILPENIFPSTIKGRVWMKNLTDKQLEEWKASHDKGAKNGGVSNLH